MYVSLPCASCRHRVQQRRLDLPAGPAHLGKRPAARRACRGSTGYLDQSMHSVLRAGTGRASSLHQCRRGLLSSRRRIVATPGQLPELQAVGHSRLAAPHSALARFWAKASPPMLTLTRLNELGRQTQNLPGEVRRFSLQLEYRFNQVLCSFGRTERERADARLRMERRPHNSSSGFRSEHLFMFINLLLSAEFPEPQRRQATRVLVFDVLVSDGA